MARYLGVDVTDNEKFYFVSYNTEDQEVVSKYVKRMGELSLPIWYDYGLKVGKKWETEIAEHIKNCEAVILFVSRNIFKKQKSYVHSEYKLASQYFKKEIYVIMLDEIDKQDVPIQYVSWWVELDELQCINAYEYDSVNDCTNSILSAIGYISSKTAGHSNNSDEAKDVFNTTNSFNNYFSSHNVNDKNSFKNEVIKEIQKSKVKIELTDEIPYSLLTHLPVKNSGIERISSIIENVYKNNAKINAKVCDVQRGIRFSTFYIDVGSASMHRCLNLQNDLQFALEVNEIRLGVDYRKKRLYVEMPTPERTYLPLLELIESKTYTTDDQNELLIPIGEDSNGEFILADLCKMPHLLIAGATGMGKSVLVNSILVSLMMKYTPNDVKFVLFDLTLLEYSQYRESPFLYFNRVISGVADSKNVFKEILSEIDKRYQIFMANGVYNINEYNNLCVKENREKLPKLVLVIDELAVVMLSDRSTFEKYIASLCMKARVAGVHLILATQRPNIDVLTGNIKANIPSRIAFKTPSFIDSKTILDESGAENLIGKGDALFKFSDMIKSERCQTPFVSNEEVKNVIEYTNQFYSEKSIEEKKSRKLKLSVLKFVIQNKRASKSEIQVAFQLSYNHVGEILNELIEEGYLKRNTNYKYVSIITMKEFEEKFKI